MTYRGALPPGQPFAGQPEQPFAPPPPQHQQQHHLQHHQLPHLQHQQQHVPQHPQHAFQQHHQPAPQLQHAQAPYANGQFFPVQQNAFLQQQGQQQQQQQQQLHQLQQQQQHQKQQQQQQAGYGGLGGFQNFEAPAYGYPQQQQQQRQPQRHPHPQHPQHQHHQPQQVPAQYTAPSAIWHQSMQQMNTPPQHAHPQHMFQSPVQSPHLQQHHVPSPQSVASPHLQQQQQHIPSPQTGPSPHLQQQRHVPSPQTGPSPHLQQQRHVPSPQAGPSPHLQQQRHVPSPQAESRPRPRPQPRPQPQAQSQPQPRRPSEQARPSPHQQQQPLPQQQPPQPVRQQPPPDPPQPRQQEPPSEPLPEPEAKPIPEPPPLQEPIHFVNLQDIQKLPEPQPFTMGNTFSLSGFGVKEEAPPRVSPPPGTTNNTDFKMENGTINPMALNMTPQPKPESKPKPPRVKNSPHSSVTHSPALSTRSPSISKRSPAMPPKPRPYQTVPLMVAVAEECLEKARASVHDVAMSLHPERVEEYQKLISTGLACLDAALQQGRLSPREEARLRLRYAAIVQEETEDLMEAETALSKGIALCDQHRLFDLKYSMQYLMLKVLFDRNHKAGLAAVDKHISDCEAFKHVQWYYAFRLLKASFYMEIGNAADRSALENIRAVYNVANRRGDKALSVFASLLEGLALMRTAKNDSIEKVRECIAQAAKFQLDPSVQIMQLDILTMLLDVASTLHREGPDVTQQKLRQLQKRLDQCDDWKSVKADFLLPIKKQPSAAKTVSSDTAAIIRPGEGDAETDTLVMSFMTKMELNSLVFTLSGLINMHKSSAVGRRSTELWQEGLKILDSWDGATTGIPYGPPIPLKAAVRQRSWRTEAQAYLNILLGLLSASHCQWKMVKQVLVKLETLSIPPTQTTLRLLSLYLLGVYHQGVGNVQMALGTFMDSRFDIPQSGTGVKAGQREIALLAAISQLWIMQHPSCRDDQRTQDLIEQLQPLCIQHPNIDLRSAWHNVMASLTTEPPQLQNEQRRHMHEAMGGAKTTNNVLELAITLCIMRSRFFQNVVGEQALKSSLAAAKQAQRSGNLLWKSVADGMLAQSYETQGHRDEGMQEWDKALREARDAFAES